MLDNRYAVLFIRGEPPVIDPKYDLMRHPNISMTPDRNPAFSYAHGTAEGVVAKLAIDDTCAAPLNILSVTDSEYELLTEQEIERLFKEEKDYEKIGPQDLFYPE